MFSSAKANDLPHCRINVIAPQINSRIPSPCSHHVAKRLSQSGHLPRFRDRAVSPLHLAIRHFGVKGNCRFLLRYDEKRHCGLHRRLEGIACGVRDLSDDPDPFQRSCVPRPALSSSSARENVRPAASGLLRLRGQPSHPHQHG